MKKKFKFIQKKKFVKIIMSKDQNKLNFMEKKIHTNVNMQKDELISLFF